MDVLNEELVNSSNCINVLKKSDDEVESLVEKNQFSENNANDEELKYNGVVVLKSNGNISVQKVMVKFRCSHCDQEFSEFDFRQHVCKYDKKKERIAFEPNEFLTLPNTNFSNCLRLLNENQFLLNSFFKNDLKYEVNMLSYCNENGLYQCSICKRNFIYATRLFNHLKNHLHELLDPIETNIEETILPKRLIKCTTCCQVFFLPDEAYSHLEKHFINKNQMWQPQIKSKSVIKTFTPRILQIAVMIYNEKFLQQNENSEGDRLLTYFKLDKILQCEFCDRFFTEVLPLLYHSQHHIPSKGFQCSSCEVMYPTSKKIFYHWQTECVFAKERVLNNLVLPTYYVCNVCQQTFISIDLLYKHRYKKIHLFPRLNGTQLEISCEFCGDVFTTAEGLIKHFLMKHKTESYMSDVSIPVYLCEYCGKQYNHSSQLLQHLKYHTGDKQFACSFPDCQRRFIIRRDLNEHIYKCHTGNRTYRCLTCGKRFLTASVYYQHRMIHRKIRRFGCDQCKKRFYRADALKIHRRIHTGERPFECIQCQKAWRQKGDLIKHIRKVHVVIENNTEEIAT